MASFKRFSNKNNVLIRCLRLWYSTSKEKVEKQPKLAADVLKYLENDSDYSKIIEKLPRFLLRKYKTPESMYLINTKTAKEIAATVGSYINEESPVVEVNPGLGFLSKELLKCTKNHLYLYETSSHFTQHLEALQHEKSKRLTYKVADFFGMWKLAFQDKMDGGNRIPELLGDLASHDKSRIIKIVGAMPGLNFVKHLIYNIVFHNDTDQLGRTDLFITMPAHHYRMDEYCLYLVNITQKEKLPCPSDYLPLLWYFFKPHICTKTTKVIPMLEQWIPGCGVWLITGQDPPDTNKVLGPNNEDAPLPHMTIFTEFGDLNLKQKITVFKRFISWPEFEQCPFRVTMESNLPKSISQIEDDDKRRLSTHLDDIDVSDGETDDHEK
ncbi:Dimethyladenosine transferase 2, mitochondrial [Papilio machaon]|uniref:rRNA adenine N(6)-methyltransferase n=1 Tax=Papilio machaon TaxID=76193 RepID=A0A194RKZ2_PAPMA|nr:Dimethyladenosine transferase 2, mitochondrial [Papilio machaon]